MLLHQTFSYVRLNVFRDAKNRYPICYFIISLYSISFLIIVIMHLIASLFVMSKRLIFFCDINSRKKINEIVNFHVFIVNFLVDLD